MKANRQDMLLTQFQMFSYVPGESLESHINRFTLLVGRCSSADMKIDNRQINKKLLSSMPPLWSSICMNIKDKVDLDESVDTVIGHLQSYDMDFKLRQPSGSQLSNVNALVSSTQYGESSSMGFGVPIMSYNPPSPSNPASSSQPSSFQGSTVPMQQVNDIAMDLSKLNLTQEKVALFGGFVSCYGAFVEGRIAPPSSDIRDLDQVNPEDVEEVDVKWMLAMASFRANNFTARTGKTLVMKEDEKLGFDKSKMRCYNCNTPGHFARECRKPKNKVSNLVNQFESSASKSSSQNMGTPQPPKKTPSTPEADKTPVNTNEEAQALVITETGGYNWNSAMEGMQKNLGLMAEIKEELDRSKIEAKLPQVLIWPMWSK